MSRLLVEARDSTGVAQPPASKAMRDRATAPLTSDLVIGTRNFLRSFFTGGFALGRSTKALKQHFDQIGDNSLRRRRYEPNDHERSRSLGGDLE